MRAKHGEREREGCNVKKIWKIIKNTMLAGMLLAMGLLAADCLVILKEPFDDTVHFVRKETPVMMKKAEKFVKSLPQKRIDDHQKKQQ